MSKQLDLPPQDDFSAYTIAVEGEKLNPNLLKIAQELRKRIIGQDRPIRRIMRALTVSEARLNNPKRPLGVMIFAGPSGVGKTHCAEELGRVLIGNPEGALDPVIKIDCTSLSEAHTIASLTGSPPGYVGYGDDVELERVGEYEHQKKIPAEIRNKVKEWKAKINIIMRQLAFSGINPEECFLETQQKFVELENQIASFYGPFRSVVIFDEIEKAHPNIHRQLLRIMDEGKLWLLNKKVIDFSGAFIILTTNIGTRQITDEYLSEKRIGFKMPLKERIDSSLNFNQKIWERVKREIKSHFPPEFLGRIGKPGIIVFNLLSYGDYEKILDLELNKEAHVFLSGKSGIGPGPLLVSYTKDFKRFIIEEGISPDSGARALRGPIEKYVKETIARGIVSGELKCGDKILLDVIPAQKDANGEIISEAKVTMRREPRPESISLPDFQLGGESKPLLDIDGIMEEFLDKLLEPYDDGKDGPLQRIIPKKPNKNSGKNPKGKNSKTNNFDPSEQDGKAVLTI